MTFLFDIANRLFCRLSTAVLQASSAPNGLRTAHIHRHRFPSVSRLKAPERSYSNRDVSVGRERRQGTIHFSRGYSRHDVQARVFPRTRPTFPSPRCAHTFSPVGPVVSF